MPKPRYIRDPFQEIRREFEDVLERFMGEGFLPPSAERAETAVISPMVDISMEGDTLRVQVDLPGVDPENVDCTLTQGVLTIRGERRKPPVEGKAGRLRERRFGQFERRIPISDDVDEDSLEARFDQGVLTITARMKTGAGQPRRIRIAGAERGTGDGQQQVQAPKSHPETGQARQGEIQSAQAPATQSQPRQTAARAQQS